MLSEEAPEVESSTQRGEVVGALQWQYINWTWRRFEGRAFGVDGKGQDRSAVSILRQKGREFKYDSFSAAKSPGKLIEHKQYMRQCSMICIIEA